MIQSNRFHAIPVGPPSLAPRSVEAGGRGAGTGGGGRGAAVTFPGVSLSAGTETAPPGATVQVKISWTEPGPILTGEGSFTFSGFDTVSGIALVGPGQDAWGVALERGTGGIQLSVLSTSSLFGPSLDYPILTIAGQVPAGAQIGTTLVLRLDPSAFHFLDPSGAVYPIEPTPVQLNVANGVAIGNVSPGSAVVPAGGTVTITGANFEPRTDIRFKEVQLAQVCFVSPTRMDVVLAETATMHGMTITAKNPDRTQSTYYSYQRTRPMSASTDPVMQFAVPLFPPKTVTTATVSLPKPEAHVTRGIALQDVDETGAYASIELLDAAGNAIAASGAYVKPSTFMVRELSELFGPAPPNASAIRVLSSAPIQVMGLTANQELGTASPVASQ